MSKSSKRRQAANRPMDGEADKGIAGLSRTVIIAGIVIVCLLIAGIWLFVLQPQSDPIVGTWTDDNNYWAYAYYSNGSAQELGWYTHRTGDTVTHIPVYMSGTWSSLGNGHYAINPDGGNMTYEAVINGDRMSISNASSQGMRKISRLPDVNQVNFNYTL